MIFIGFYITVSSLCTHVFNDNTRMRKWPRAGAMGISVPRAGDKKMEERCCAVLPGGSRFVCLFVFDLLACLLAWWEPVRFGWLVTSALTKTIESLACFRSLFVCLFLYCLGSSGGLFCFVWLASLFVSFSCIFSLFFLCFLFILCLYIFSSFSPS